MTNPLDQLLRDVRVARELPPPLEARAIRECAGVSISRLAKTLAVHRSTLSRWENGLTAPRSSVRASYAAALAALQSELAR
jgi:DNA-binding transcriptional regulator YiaG